MKKILLSMAVFILSSCGPSLYSTMSSGKEDVSYIVVLKKGNIDQQVSLAIDNNIYPVEKVYNEKVKRKAHPFVTTPGKHQLKILSNGKILYEENVFLGLQETKKIILE